MGASQFTIHDSVKTELETIYQEICDTLYQEDGIESAGDYVEKIDQDGESDFSDDVIENFSQVPMRALTRAYPGGNQDIVIAELNPKLNTDPQYFRESEPEERKPLDYITPVADKGAYTDDFVSACVEDWKNNNFGETNKRVTYRLEILKELNKVGSTVDFDDINTYTHSSDSPNVYNDVYFTNVCKFATPDGDDLDAFSEIKKQSAEHFINEIKEVDPDLVIGLGNLIEEVLDAVDTNAITYEDTDAPDNQITDLHGHAWSVSDWSDAILVAGVHPGRWWLNSDGPPVDVLNTPRVADII